MIFVTVLPNIARVKDKLGPWPRSAGLAYRQLGFPRCQYRSTSDPGRILPEVAKPAFNSAALCLSN